MSIFRNPYNLPETLERLKKRLGEQGRELLEKAEAKAKIETEYAEQFKNTLLFGSTLQYREIFSYFGNYAESAENDFRNAVNCVDNAMHHLKIDAISSFFVAGCVDDGKDVFRVDEIGLTDEDAEFFTLYGVYEDGLSYAIYDFPTRELAEKSMENLLSR